MRNSRDAQRQARRLMRAKHAASPRLRGAYRRFVRAARREREGEDGAGAPHRRPMRAVFVLALLPVLLTAVVGMRIIAFYDHLKGAVDTISTSSVGDIVHGTAAPGLAPGADPKNPGISASVPTALPPPRFDRKDPFTILMLGVDTRAGDTDPSHSDTIILGYIDPQEKIGHLLSIPRDLRVRQPTGGLAKMADVYANGDALKYKGVGGVAFVWDTIEQNFQLKIDYYAQVDFGGFRKIVDAVGGVTVDNPYPIKDDSYPTEDYQFTRIFFPAGMMHLGGDEALKFARTRHDDADGDFARNRRQQQVILGVREQALKLNLLSKGTELIDALKETVRTDFPPDQWLGLGRLAVDLRKDAIKQYSLSDLLGSDETTGVYYATVDWQKATALARDFSPKENFGTIRTALPPGTNTAAPVTVENGTLNGGLAKRWVAVMEQAGFSHTAAIDAPPAAKGKTARTTITYYGANHQTAAALAKIFNIDAGRIQDGKAKRPPGVPADTAILVVLGDDTPEPAQPPPS